MFLIKSYIPLESEKSFFSPLVELNVPDSPQSIFRSSGDPGVCDHCFVYVSVSTETITSLTADQRGYPRPNTRKNLPLYVIRGSSLETVATRPDSRM